MTRTVAAFGVALRWDLFRLRLPRKAGIDYYDGKIGPGFLGLSTGGAAECARARVWALAEVRAFEDATKRVSAKVRGAYKLGARTLVEVLKSIPVRLEGFQIYAKAATATQDVAFGIVVIAAVVAILGWWRPSEPDRVNLSSAFRLSRVPGS